MSTQPDATEGISLHVLNRLRPGRRVSGILAVVCLSVFIMSAQALGEAHPASPRSDPLAMDRIFAQQHLTESGIGVCQRAAAMQPDQRYAFLLAWVLPGENHLGFRVTADFASANHAASETGALSKPTRIVSPAIDLIETAKQLNRRDELRQSIERCPAYSSDDQINQTALLAIVAIDNDDEAQSKALLERLFAGVMDDAELMNRVRDAILLCAERASESAACSAFIRESMATVIQRYIGDVERSAWHRQFWDTNAKIVLQADQDQSSEQIDDPNWHPVSRITAFEHGSAFPTARWAIEHGRVRNVSSLGDDFLYFSTPLQGSFDVETDVTGFSYRDSQFMVAGNWVGLLFNHRQYSLGNVRGELTRFELSPPMSSTHTQTLIHYRTAVRNHIASTYCSGRKIHEQPLSDSPDPWLAIRSSYRHDGGVDDLRISGSPTIPESIAMVESPSLLGWYDYYQPPVFSSPTLSDWRAEIDPTGPADRQTFVVASPRIASLPEGSFAERMLVYARPMMEDGVIEYEFWYSPTGSIAHPAIGHQCLVLRPEGVRIHHVTDGIYERSNLRPDNMTAAPERTQLPLLADAWNQMRIEQNSGEVTLTLNGKTIYQFRPSVEKSQRTFGLFHFADQTELQVRSLRWAGQWPRELPPLSEQSLAIYENRFLDQSAEALPHKFAHIFGVDSIESGKFIVAEGDSRKDVRVTAGGVILSRQGRDGYQSAAISPTLNVGGDFDITVRYDQLACDAGEKKTASIRMSVSAANERSDHASIIRAESRSGEQITQCLKMQTIGGREGRHYFASQPMETVSGRLRLSRRNDKIYYLVSENDSTQFRIVGQEVFDAANLQDHGIQIGLQVQGDGSQTTVRFTEFHVSAERLSGIAIDGQDELISKLNAQRDALPASFTHDFSLAAPKEEDFVRWPNGKPWHAGAGGLVIEASGADTWTSAGLSVQRRFEGDFDISVYFDRTELATPANGKLSDVYLQIELDDDSETQLSAILRKTETGQMNCQAQMGLRTNDRYSYSSHGSVSIGDPDYLRILRRGTKIHFIAGNLSRKQELVFASTEASDARIGLSGVRMLLHTGGAGRTSQVTLKSIQVRAARETKMTQLPNTRSVPEQPNSTFELLRNLLK